MYSIWALGPIFGGLQPRMPKIGGCCYKLNFLPSWPRVWKERSRDSHACRVAARLIDLSEKCAGLTWFS